MASRQVKYEFTWRLYGSVGWASLPVYIALQPQQSDCRQWGCLRHSITGNDVPPNSALQPSSLTLRVPCFHLLWKKVINPSSQDFSPFIHRKSCVYSDHSMRQPYLEWSTQLGWVTWCDNWYIRILIHIDQQPFLLHSSSQIASFKPSTWLWSLSLSATLGPTSSWEQFS